MKSVLYAPELHGSNTFGTLTLAKGSGKPGHGPVLGLAIGDQQSWSPVSGRSNLCVGLELLDLISSSSIPSLSLLQKGQAFLQLLPWMRHRACLLLFI